MSKLTTAEAADLERLEGVVTAGVRTFVEVGLALAEIRDRRLYRATHGDDFETYCRERWGWSRQRSAQLIAAATVVEGMSTIVDTPRPATESQARELIPVPAEKRVEVMEEAARAAAPKPPTAKDVKQAARPYITLAERLERAEKAAERKARRGARELESADAAAAAASQQKAPNARPPRRPPIHRLKELVRVAVDLEDPSVDELDAIPANDLMLEHLERAHRIIGLILTRNGRGTAA